jgi:zinc protease
VKKQVISANGLGLIILFILGNLCTLSAQQIPMDPTIRKGKLKNGLTYYIKSHPLPKQHAELFLVNNVGSILEDDDQQGLAHFMEHMNFNGTKKYPKNELIDFLQKAGIRFGADLNALTGFDETIYKLPIPTNDPTFLERGLDILREWATEATIDPEEVKKESGIILEEGRLRKGLADRMGKKYLPMLLNDSRYVYRFPIGKEDIVANASAETIRRFYEDWYRPNLQAIIVVGDVDVKSTEILIEQVFGNLTNPVKERKREAYGVPLLNKNQFMAVIDEEKADVSIQILYKRAKVGLSSVLDYQRELQNRLLSRMIERRRQSFVRTEKDAAFTNLGISRDNFLGGLETFAFVVDTKQGRIREAFEQTYQLFARIKSKGFTEKDLQQAKSELLADMSRAQRDAPFAPSADLANALQRSFISGEVLPGIDWEVEEARRILPDILLDAMDALIAQYTADHDRDILVLAPSHVSDIPSEDDILQWMAAIEQSDLDPFTDYVVEKTLLPTVPNPGKVVQQKTIAEIGATELQLENGVRVLLKPTDYKASEVSIGAFAKGGLSLYDDKDYYNAVNALPIINSFGYGDLNAEELSRVLQGKTINVSSSMEQRALNMRGRSSQEDLEEALQLIYLMFTQPRKDTVMFRNIVGRTKEGLRSRSLNPTNVFSDTVSYVMGSYNFRFQPPTIEKVDGIQLEETYRIYRERFADASSFTFVFVGNFETQRIIPLLEKYIGSLPATFHEESMPDRGLHVPRGRLVKKVYAGSEDMARVQMVITGDYIYAPRANIALKVIAEVLQMRILQNLREEAGEVYSPSVQSVSTKYPKNRFGFFVNFGCAPQNATHLTMLVQEEVERLRKEGVTADELQKFKVTYNTNFESAQQNNDFWRNYVLGQYENDLPMDEINYNLKWVNDITLQEIAETVPVFLGQDNRIDFILLPTGSSY